jgi:hypothetical protein
LRAVFYWKSLGDRGAKKWLFNKESIFEGCELLVVLQGIGGPGSGFLIKRVFLRAVLLEVLQGIGGPSSGFLIKRVILRAVLLEVLQGIGGPEVAF